MKILFFIDSLGSGGAQRQLVNLAIVFKNKGFDVCCLTYYESDFYLKLLTDFDIPTTTLKCGNAFSRIIKCRSFIRKGRFDAVISFLETPSLINEIAGFPYHNWKVIVGERSAAPRILKSAKGRFLRFMHFGADYVVSNSNFNRDLIRKANPFLSENKCKVIYNLYDTKTLIPKIDCIQHMDCFRLVIGASHQKLKNLKTLADAVSLLEPEKKNRLKIDWYGAQINPCFKDSILYINQLNLQSVFTFYPPTKELYNKMAEADAVGLFSLYEGLPNTICEAMCMGKMVIASDVSDNRLLIRDENLLSNPLSPQEMAVSLSYLMNLSQEERENIEKDNRKFSEEHFSEEQIYKQYLQLIK